MKVSRPVVERPLLQKEGVRQSFGGGGDPSEKFESMMRRGLRYFYDALGLSLQEHEW